MSVEMERVCPSCDVVLNTDEVGEHHCPDCGRYWENPPERPTRAAIAEMLTNVTKVLEDVVEYYGSEMPERERNQRNQLCKESRALLEKLK